MSLEKKDDLKREMIIKISNNEIKKKNDKKIDELSKSLKLKGFRKGFIPKRIIENRFGKSIHKKNISIILNQEFVNNIKEKNINVVDKPSIKEVINNENEVSSFKLEFEIFPKIELNLANVKIQKYITRITDADVNKEIDRLKLKHCEWKEIEAESKQNDLIIFDLYKKKEEKNQYILNKEKITLDENEHEIKNLKLYLINKNVNIEYSFSIKNNKLSILNENTRDLVYVFIHKIKRKYPAIINEEFIKKIGFKDTDVAKLNSSIKEKLIFISNYLSEKIMKSDILENILTVHNFNVPTTLVKKELSINSNKNKIVKSIKLRLLLLEIKKKFNISISKMEIEKYINLLHKNDRKIMKNDSVIKNIENEIYMDKILKIIEKKINISEKYVNLDYLMKLGDSK